MKRRLTTIAFATTCITLSAQVAESRNGTNIIENEIAIERQEQMNVDGIAIDNMAVDAVDINTTDTTKVNLPLFNNSYSITRPTLFGFWNPAFPYASGGWWNVHEGLNVQIGMGVVAGFGKNNPFRGGSFYSDLSMLYAKKLNERWTIALGGTLARFKMWNEPMNIGTIEALANYKINERLSATVFGSYTDPYLFAKSQNQNLPFMNKCAEIGAELTYKFSESFSMSISVSDNMFRNSGNTGLPPFNVEKAPMHNERR